MTFLRYLYEKYSPLYTLKIKDNFSKRKKQENKGKK
jgi:hypothetical protein